MAGGGISRLAIARLQSAGVPVMPLLKLWDCRRRALRLKRHQPNSYRSIQLKPGGEKLASVGFAEHLAFSTKFWMSLTFGDVRFGSIWTVDDPDELIVRQA